MNKLEDDIRVDLFRCMKDRDQRVVDALRVVLGEIPRLNMKANESATDDQIINIVKKLIKSEKETLKLKGEDITESFYINLLKADLPKMVTEAEILEYIQSNIDFSALKNKMQAVGVINKHFGSSVNGGMVAHIIQNRF